AALDVGAGLRHVELEILALELERLALPAPDEHLGALARQLAGLFGRAVDPAHRLVSYDAPGTAADHQPALDLVIELGQPKRGVERLVERHQQHARAELHALRPRSRARDEQVWGRDVLPEAREVLADPDLLVPELVGQLERREVITVRVGHAAARRVERHREHAEAHEGPSRVRPYTLGDAGGPPDRRSVRGRHADAFGVAPGGDGERGRARRAGWAAAGGARARRAGRARAAWPRHLLRRAVGDAADRGARPGHLARLGPRLRGVPALGGGGWRDHPTHAGAAGRADGAVERAGHARRAGRARQLRGVLPDALHARLGARPARRSDARRAAPARRRWRRG